MLKYVLVTITTFKHIFHAMILTQDYPIKYKDFFVDAKDRGFGYILNKNRTKEVIVLEQRKL